MHTIEVPYSAEHNNGCVSGLAASKCGLMAVLEENAQNLFIYNHERRDVLEFPLNSPVIMNYQVYSKWRLYRRYEMYSAFWEVVSVVHARRCTLSRNASISRGEGGEREK